MKITGLMIYYYFVCKRRLWYFYNDITMEQNSELVEIGKILDETSYKREKKSIIIDETINIDFIKDTVVIHEVKKTRAIEEAAVWQVKYYMYYLKQKGIKDIKAIIDYPLMKQTCDVELLDKDIKTIENIQKEIEKIVIMDKPLECKREQICKKCSYYDLCYI